MIIFTDLDGSLLDPDYTCHHAGPALEWIAKHDHQLIFVTSKTRSEVSHLQERLGMDAPFISENGGGIHFPLRYKSLIGVRAFRSGPSMCVRLGRSYSEIRNFFDTVKSSFGLSGFTDFSDHDLGRITGLSPAEAARARRREFTEPFVMADETKLGSLKEAAAVHGLKIVRGGLFFHLMGHDNDKGNAVLLVKRLLDPTAEIVALGDEENDANMLRMADVPIQIPRLDGSFPEIGDFPVHHARWPGSKGWNDAIMSISEFGTSRWSEMS